MSTSEDAAKIRSLEALANDKQHLRKSALRMAGSLLQASEQEVVEQLVNDLHEDIVEEGSDLYNAYEALYLAIAKEVVRIGRELSQQAKGASSWPISVKSPEPTLKHGSRTTTEPKASLSERGAQ